MAGVALASLIDGAAAAAAVPVPLRSATMGVMGRSVVADPQGRCRPVRCRGGARRSRPHVRRARAPLFAHHQHLCHQRIRTRAGGRRRPEVHRIRRLVPQSTAPSVRTTGRRVRGRPVRLVRAGGGRRLGLRFRYQRWATAAARALSQRSISRSTIVGELAGPGLGEVHAIAGAQPPGLAFKFGTRLGIVAVLIDEAVPDVDIDDAGLVGADCDRDRSGMGYRPPMPAPQWRQTDPKHRYTRCLERRDGVVDPPDIRSLQASVRNSRVLLPREGCGSGAVGPSGSEHFGFRACRARTLRCRPAAAAGFTSARVRRDLFPHLLAVVDPNHHQHEFRFLRRDHSRAALGQSGYSPWRHSAPRCGSVRNWCGGCRKMPISGVSA